MIRASGTRRVPIRPLPVLLLILVVAAPARAQKADFLFGRPHLTLSLGTGWAMAGEGSDLFAQTREDLTVSRGDFASYPLILEAAARVDERLDVALGLEYVGATAHSEMREYVTLDDRPIPQATEFDRTRLTGSVRWYLLPRGRSLAEYVWVPNAWSPYVGAGLGVVWYEYRQYGDFVDFDTLDIYALDLRSKGTGFTQHVMAGADVSLSARFLIRGEYRYIWGKAPVDQQVFEGFDDLDLSGSRVALGIAVRM